MLHDNTILLDKYVNNGIPLSIIHANHSSEFPFHSHNFAELVIVLEGSATHCSDETDDFQVSHGDVFIVSPKQRHSYKNVKKLELVNLIFRFDELQLPLYDLKLIPGFFTLFHLEPNVRLRNDIKHRLSLTADQLSYVKQLTLKMEREQEKKQDGFQSMLTTLFSEIIIYLSRAVSGSNDKEYIVINKFAKVLGYIEDHFTSEIKAENLAKLANMSRRNFQREFKRIVGTNPLAYILDLKIENAKKLLVNTNLNMSEISQQTGFPDSNYFSRKFKEHTYMTPREYRKHKTI